MPTDKEWVKATEELSLHLMRRLTREQVYEDKNDHEAQRAVLAIRSLIREAQKHETSVQSL
jgi:hypothetical protein